jgi:hypothetical protein
MPRDVQRKLRQPSWLMTQRQSTPKVNCFRPSSDGKHWRYRRVRHGLIIQSERDGNTQANRFVVA